MRINGIEWDFIKDVRKARPEDCKTIIDALYTLDGREDEDGELTPLGFLVGAVTDELMLNGMMKRNDWGKRVRPLYKECYEVRKVKNPESFGKHGRYFSVTHFVPIENETCLAFAGIRYFYTQEEAEAYKEAQEARLNKTEKAKA